MTKLANRVKQSSLMVALSLGLLWACNTNKTEKRIQEEVESKDTVICDSLLNKFKELKTDTTEIYSMYNLEGKKYEFEGIELSEHEIERLPENFVNEKPGGTGYFACYQFTADSNYTGLIIRVPAEYESSDIYLFLYNKTDKSIKECKILARSFGDGGDVEDIKSWLVNENGKFKAYTLQLNEHYNVVDDTADHSVTRNKTASLLSIPSCFSMNIGEDKFMRFEK